MADLIEALHTLARERARGGPSPLVALRQFAARPGARISHLGISQRLSQAWITVTGEPFRPHQSLALSALRRGEPLALVGGQGARQTLQLLSVELLRSEAPATVLLLAPDEQDAAAQRGELDQLLRALHEPLRVGLAQGPDARAAMSAQVVVATPQSLHERLLRHHGRAWSSFWPRLRLVALAAAHSYDGLAAAHLAWLILRARRLTTGQRAPQLAATVAPVAGADEALALIAGEPWRFVPAADGPAPAAALAFWRPTGGSQDEAKPLRAREAAALALGLARAGVSVHLTCAPFEAPLLRGLVGADVAAVSVGPSPLPATVQIFAGLADTRGALQQSLDGAALTVLLLGDDPAERTLARLAGSDPEQLPAIDGPPPAWVAAPGNAYVAAQHLVCAASERPLADSEIEAWQVASVVARLEQHGQLVQLPDAAWQPLADDGDAYAGFDLRAAGAPPARIRDDQGGYLAPLDLASFDRWGFAGAALPPMRGGFRVRERDEHALTLTVRSAPEARRTFPLRRCTVRVRDRREHRAVGGRELAWGRVVISEEVYGFREASTGSAPAERVINPPLTGEWSGPACWIDLPSGVSASGQLVGWSLVAALPFRALSAATDLVPAYDAEARRIYFVDAQPGGNGVAAWLYTAIEELLPLAYDVALDCRGDALLEPLARADMDWLLALLARGKGARRQGDKETGEEAAPEPPRPVPALRSEPPRPAPPARSEPPLRQEPPRRESPPPARSEPPLRQEPPRREAPPPARAEPPVGQEPPRPAPPARSEPPLRQEPPRREAQPTQPELPLPPAPARAGQARRERRAGRATPPPPRPAQTRGEPASPPPPLSSARGASAVSPSAGARSEPRPAGGSQDEAKPLRSEPRPAEEPLPDAAAMVARLKRMREQRERREPRPRPTPRAAVKGGFEPRFHPGDQIVCSPYGAGEVLESRVEDERELLVVDFPDHGELTIDAAVSAARLADDGTPPEDTDF